MPINRSNNIRQLVNEYPVASVLLVVIVVLLLQQVWIGFGIGYEQQYYQYYFSHFRSYLGVLLMQALLRFFLAVTVSKKYAVFTKQRRIWQLLVAVAMVAYYHALPLFMDSYPSEYLFTVFPDWYVTIYDHLFLQLVAVILLFVVPLGIATKRSPYHLSYGVTTLVMHLVLAGLFSLLLAGGLAGALQGISLLFGLSVASERFASIFAIVFPLFGGFIFLDGIRKWEPYSAVSYQPETWKRLLVGVILALLVVYGVILYLYLLNILLLRQWPSNQVTLRSFVFAGLVVLASLFLMPVFQEKKWGLSRERMIVFLYSALWPVILMVACAIWLRVQQYGLTEPRYAVIAIILWLMVSSIYMIVNPKKDLWVVAVVFIIFVLIGVLGGPLSARSLSIGSQIARLESTMQQFGMNSATTSHIDGDFLTMLDQKQRQTIANILYYLAERDPRIASNYTGSQHGDARQHLQDIGLSSDIYEGYPGVEDPHRFFDGQTNHGEGRVIFVEGYTRFFSSLTAQSDSVTLSGTNLLINISENQYTISLEPVLAERFATAGNIGAPGNEMFRKEINYDEMPNNEMVVETDQYKLMITGIGGRTDNEENIIERINFDLLVR